MLDSHEKSVAPEERINIVYKTHKGNVMEEKELPLKLLVTGDYNGTPDETPLSQRKPVSVDKDTFNEVLKKQNVNLSFQVPDKLSDNPKGELNVSLSFASMDDFGPERLAMQVPELRAHLEMRNALAALKGPMASFPEFRKKLESLIKDENARKQILMELG